MYNLNFIVDGKLLNRILGKAAVFAFFTQAIALVALLIRNAAGIGSLFGFAGRSYEPLPILLFLRGDFNPLTERAVVDLRCGLIVVVLHKNGLLSDLLCNPQGAVKSAYRNEKTAERYL